MVNEYGAGGGIITGRGNQIVKRKPAPVPLSSPQIPYYMTWDQVRAVELESRQLTAISGPSLF
jgi:hypothetical protein